MMQFELPKEQPSIIKVIGVGGGGSNAVNYMYNLGIKGVEFLICNTDNQALERSPIPHKVQLGPSLTEGRGAGALPEVGKNAALENIEEIKNLLSTNTKMVFITAGMGGGTGTGAAPIIASIARELGILTVAIVTIPFAFEGKKRKAQATAGIEDLKQNVDTLLVICNDKLREIHGNLKLSDAFGHADNILAVAAKSIAEIITSHLHINVDFADIETVMKNSGVAIMGSATGEGENRAIEAVTKALDSPLLNDSEIEGARYILLNITSGNQEVLMDEIGEITDYIQDQAGMTADVIMGVGTDESLGDSINVTIIATGFKTKDHLDTVIEKKDSKVLYSLEGTVLNVEDENSELETESETDEIAGVNPLEPTLKVVQPDIPAKEILNPVSKVQDEPVGKIETRIIHTLTEDNRIITNEEELEEPVSYNDNSSVSSNESDLEESDTDNTFVFEVQNKPVMGPVNPEPEVRREIFNRETAEQDQKANNDPETVASGNEDLYARAKARISALKEMSMKINTPSGLSDMEKEPAYKRKGIQLDKVVPSDQTNVSRHTLSTDSDRPEIKPNNPFLHDRVD